MICCLIMSTPTENEYHGDIFSRDIRNDDMDSACVGCRLSCPPFLIVTIGYEGHYQQMFYIISAY